MFWHDSPSIPDDRVSRLVNPLVLVPATITLAGLPLVIDLVHQFLVDHLRGKFFGLATSPCTQRLSQIMTGVQVGQHHRISRTLIGGDHTIFSINRKQIFLRVNLSINTTGDRSHGPSIGDASGHDLTRGVTRRRVHTELGPLDGLHDPLIELGTSRHRCEVVRLLGRPHVCRGAFIISQLGVPHAHVLGMVVLAVDNQMYPLLVQGTDMPLVGVHPGNRAVDLVGFIIPRGDESHVELLDPIPVIIHKVFQSGFHVIMAVFQGIKRDQRVDVRLAFHSRVQLRDGEGITLKLLAVLTRHHPVGKLLRLLDDHRTHLGFQTADLCLTGGTRGKEGEDLIPVVVRPQASDVRPGSPV